MNIIMTLTAHIRFNRNIMGCKSAQLLSLKADRKNGLKKIFGVKITI